jgi:hypothetical protein
MAAPQQYIGKGGVPAPADLAEGTDSYRETWRAQPFGAAGSGTITADETFIPGRQNEVTRTVLASLTRGTAGLGAGTPAAGTRRQVIVSSVTHNPFSHVEFGRISEN